MTETKIIPIWINQIPLNRYCLLENDTQNVEKENEKLEKPRKDYEQSK